MPDIVLRCEKIDQAFGPKRVLYDVHLEIARGQIVSLVGPSGCGKSTLLRAILGTHPPQSGQVLMNGKPVQGPGRDRGIVYQRYSLYPFLTAEKNVAFGPMLDQTSPLFRLFAFWKWWKLRRVHLQQSREMLEKFGLAGALHQYPAQLSGGMSQRVAIAQALILRPQILLLDEPFGALDEATREDMQAMLLELYAENLAARREGRPPPYTILLVTHELAEALYVAERVIGLSQHWMWEESGEKSPPGATVVYDAVSPVFSRRSDTEAAAFTQQREELRRAVFEPDPRPSRYQYVRYWDEIKQGKGVGVMSPEFVKPDGGIEPQKTREDAKK